TLGQVLLWQNPDADFLGFGLASAGDDARRHLSLRAGAGAEPCAAERRRRRGRGYGRLIDQHVRSSLSYYISDLTNRNLSPWVFSVNGSPVSHSVRMCECGRSINQCVQCTGACLITSNSKSI